MSDYLVEQNMESAQQINSPKNMMSAHQTKDRILTLKKITI